MILLLVSQERLRQLRSALRDAPPEGYPAGPTMACRVVAMDPGAEPLGAGSCFSKVRGVSARTCYCKGWRMLHMLLQGVGNAAHASARGGECCTCFSKGVGIAGTRCLSISLPSWARLGQARLGQRLG